MADSRVQKLLESFFPLVPVNRLVQSELRAFRLCHPIFRWWHPRPAALWRSLLLAGLIDRDEWNSLESAPVGLDPDAGCPPENLSADGGPPETWHRLYYRLDAAAERTIRTHVQGREVLDLFAGGGTILTEGMRLGADVMGVDSNPVAWFTLKKSTEGVSNDALQAALQQVEASVRSEIDACYHTTCPQCGQDARSRHTFWVRTIVCPEPGCGTTIPLFNSFLLPQKAGRHRAALLVCPACGSVYRDEGAGAGEGSTCPECTAIHSAEVLASGRVDGATAVCPGCKAQLDWQELLKQQPLSYRMVALEVSCPACGGVFYKQPDADDLSLYDSVCRRLAEQRDRLQLPDQPIPEMLAQYVGPRLADFGFRRWSDVCNPRQLWLLAQLRDAILSLDDLDAAEHLLLAWAETAEYYNLISTYLPGSRWTHTIYSPRPFVPWTLSIESNLWGEPESPDTFRGQMNLAAAELSQAHEPAALCLSPGGRRAFHPIGNGAVPPRSRRVLLRFPVHALTDAQLALLSIDLAVVDPPTPDPTAIAYLSDFLYAWLRTALARDYPVVFARPEIEKPPAADQAEDLTEALLQLWPSLTDDGLVVWALHRRPGDPWGDSLTPLVEAGYDVQAMHPIRLAGTDACGIEDRCRSRMLVLVVARKRETVAEEITWAQLEERLIPDVSACLDEWWPQVEAGHLGPTEVAVEALGVCLRRLCPFVAADRRGIAWRGQPLTLAQALDGDPTSGIRGITQLVDLAVFQREAQLWPASVDDVTRLYLTTLLGQSVLPEKRLAWRLEAQAGCSLDDLQQQRLVRCRDGRARVLTAGQRSVHLRRRWAQEQSGLVRPQLPGLASGTEQLKAIDRLHLLLGLLPGDEDIRPWLAGWRQVDSLADLSGQIADRLPRSARRRRYARLAVLLQEAASATA